MDRLTQLSCYGCTHPLLVNLQITTTLADLKNQERQNMQRKCLKIEGKSYSTDIYMISEFQTPGCVDSIIGELRVVKTKQVEVLKH